VPNDDDPGRVNPTPRPAPGPTEDPGNNPSDGPEDPLIHGISDFELEMLLQRLAQLGLRENYDKLINAMPSEAAVLVNQALIKEHFVNSELLTIAFFTDLEKALASNVNPTTRNIEKLTIEQVKKVVQNYQNPDTGKGLAELLKLKPDLSENEEFRTRLDKAGVILHLDIISNSLTDEKRELFASSLIEALEAPQNTPGDKKLKKLIKDEMQALR